MPHPKAAAIRGLFGQPFVDLEPYVDLSPLGAIHDEICLALTQIPVEYTGGSHRSMGIVPPSRADDVINDYGEVIRGLDDEAFATFRALADDPSALADTSQSTPFGEERAHALSRRQMLWLKFRHGVYFPWKVYVEMIPNRDWSDKSTSEGKDFTRVARTFLPKTVAYAKSLPFASIGRCNIMGLEANDHGTVHRDGEPEEQSRPDQFVTFCPAGNKRLFLWDEAQVQKTTVDARVYWFNDHDYHGVDADPFFRYSVRVDGVFTADFLERLERDAGKR